MIIEKRKISELKPAPYNPRKSDVTQEANLKASLEKFGVVEPIIFNKQTGYIVGGHFRIRELKKLGIKDVDCVIVDLSPEDEKELNIRLNANTGEWDMELLSEWDKQDLEEWGLELEWGETGGESENDYTNKITAPTYEPKNEKPDINILYDIEKTKDLINKIDSSSLDKGEKDFLKIAAQRHIVFNYENIADYYSHSNKEAQELMEESALVIIDFNKAIELGYVKLSEEIAEQYAKDYDEE